MIIKKSFGVERYNLLYNILVSPPSHLTKHSDKILLNNEGAEIGVFYGDTSIHLLKKIPSLKLYCVDPWDSYDEYKEEHTKERLKEAEKNARSRLSHFSERAIIIKERSCDACKNIKDNSLDFIFIDGNHEYEFVKEDFASWFPKVRIGGLVSGHDFRWRGVAKFVEEINVNFEIFVSPLPSDVWYFIKTKGVL
jgi:hypothetical protein